MGDEFPEIEEKLKALKEYKKNMFKIVLDCLLENQTQGFIIDANTQNQLYERGETREGIKIGDFQPYTPFTMEIKMDKGQPFDRVTLRDEGDFYRDFFIQKVPNGVKIWSRNEKTDDLVEKYSDEIFGLNENNLEELAEDYVLPHLIETLSKYLADGSRN